MAYATVDELRDHLGLTNTRDQALLEARISAAEATVNRFCGRNFNPPGETAESRVFRVTDSCVFDCPYDIATAEDLVIETDIRGDGSYACTWLETDYVLDPLNGIGPDGLPGWPYRTITSIISNVGAKYFPWKLTRIPPLRITAFWGWLAVPPAINMATIFIASDMYHRKDLRMGVLGTEQFGGIRIGRDAAMASAGLLELYCVSGLP